MEAYLVAMQEKVNQLKEDNRRSRHFTNGKNFMKLDQIDKDLHVAQVSIEEEYIEVLEKRIKRGSH